MHSRRRNFKIFFNHFQGILDAMISKSSSTVVNVKLFQTSHFRAFEKIQFQSFLQPQFAQQLTQHFHTQNFENPGIAKKSALFAPNLCALLILSPPSLKCSSPPLSKALSVQKKMRSGRTDTQTDRQTHRSFY